MASPRTRIEPPLFCAAMPARVAMRIAGQESASSPSVASRTSSIASIENCMAPAMSSSPATSRPNTATRPSMVWLCRSAPCL